MYKLKLSRRDTKKLALSRLVLIVLAIIGLALVVWLAWIRPIQTAASIDTFDKCRAAGNTIQETYPEVCLTKDGKRFVHPGQSAAHDASLDNTDEPVAPTNPDLLYLDIKEWNVRVPLTEATFDLMYVYLEDGLSDRVHLTYKRLVNANVCAGDIGLAISRLGYKREPPYNFDNPAPVANVGKHYYYPAFAGSPCYDPDNNVHVALVKKIVGDQSLVLATSKLFEKLEVLPD